MYLPESILGNGEHTTFTDKYSLSVMHGIVPTEAKESCMWPRTELDLTLCIKHTGVLVHWKMQEELYK